MGKVTGAVIVAAGMSSRMNDFKPMMKIGGYSIIERVIQKFNNCGVAPIVVVIGHNGGELKDHLIDQPVVIIKNQEYATTGMFESAKLGFEYIQDKCDEVFFTPADIPMFTEQTLYRLMETKGDAVKPVYDEKGGHPLLIRKSILPCINEYKGDKGLKGALKSCNTEVKRVQVADEGILYDADTQEDYKKLVDFYEVKNSNLDNKYRAWDKDAKIMVYSDYRNKNEYFCDYQFAVTKNGVECLWSQEFEDSCGNPAYDNGKLDNIQLYSGYKDKNGSEIYEGDIVGNNDKKGVVNYSNGEFNVDGKELSTLEEKVVVGNIYK